MTNREWLSTLTNEQFTEWLLIEPIPVVYHKEGNDWICEAYDPIQPRLKEIACNTSSSYLSVLYWLSQEHKEFPKIIHSEVNKND